MYSLVEQAEKFNAVDTKAKETIQKLLRLIKPLASSKMLPRSDDLLAASELSSKIYLLREGKVGCLLEERALYFLDEGDLVCGETCHPASGMQVLCEFAVVVDEYSRKEFFDALADKENRELWHAYLEQHCCLMSLMMSALSKKELVAMPLFHHYSNGDTIVCEGAEGDRVFTLVEGHANVLVKGVKVGEILKDEIFGALAALTDTTRTATVVATEPCMVLALPKEKFIELIDNRPHTVLKLVEDMARTIMSLNQKVVGYTLGKV